MTLLMITIIAEESSLSTTLFSRALRLTRCPAGETRSHSPCRLAYVL